MGEFTEFFETAGGGEQEKIIDVLIVIDAETILSTYTPSTDSNNPTQVTDTSLIYAITKENESIGGNAAYELNIAADVLDNIRWRETTLSLNAQYTAILYAFTASGGATLISAPFPVMVTMQEPLPNASAPLSPTTQTVQNYFWQTTVEAVGKVTYQFRFMILDRNGAVQGYYYWDPYITISN